MEGQRGMDLSRETFYRDQNAVAEGGIQALFDSNRRQPNPKYRAEKATETALLAYATEQPAHGQVRASNELRQRAHLRFTVRRSFHLAAQ